MALSLKCRPRQKIGESIRSGYALRAGLALSITDTAITESKLADNAVTVSKLASSAVTDDKLASGAVTSTKIETSAVTNSKLASSSVTTDKLADNVVTPTKLAGSGGSALASGTNGDALVSNGDGTFGWKNLNQMNVTKLSLYNISSYHLSLNQLGIVMIYSMNRSSTSLYLPDPLMSKWRHLIIIYDDDDRFEDLNIQDVNGHDTKTLNNYYESIHLFSTGDEWIAIGGNNYD